MEIGMNRSFHGSVLTVLVMGIAFACLTTQTALVQADHLVRSENAEWEPDVEAGVLDDPLDGAEALDDDGLPLIDGEKGLAYDDEDDHGCSYDRSE